MPDYNFKPEFAEAVRTGRKCQAIRKTRRGARVGDRAVLYTGQRTKACEKLGEGVITEIQAICIDRWDDGDVWIGLDLDTANSGAYFPISMDEETALARADGFDSAESMAMWFEKQYGPLPFFGFVHKWRLE